jgi:hypothetical protein
MTKPNVGFVTNKFEPTMLLQVTQAERPVIEDVEIVPLLVVNVQRLLVLSLSTSVSPTLTIRPIPCERYWSLVEIKTFLTMVFIGKEIVKEQKVFCG